jgi:hypothetical protein
MLQTIELESEDGDIGYDRISQIAETMKEIRWRKKANNRKN